MTSDQFDNVVSIGQGSGKSSALFLIANRRHDIQQRISEIDAETHNLREERRALFHEDQALIQAENTIKKLPSGGRKK